MESHKTGLPEFDVFNAWTARYLGAPDEEKKALVDEGITLASARRSALANLIPSDPRRAIENAQPPIVRQELPKAVAARLEERFNERAAFRVLGTSPAEGSTELSAYLRDVRTEDGGFYQAFVYGNRTAQVTTESAFIVGIAVGDVLAVDERPLRIVQPGEIPNHPNNLTYNRTIKALDERGFSKDPELREGHAPAHNIVETCPISGKSTAPAETASGQPAPVTPEQVVVEAGGQIHYLCAGGHVSAFEGNLVAQEGGNGGPSLPTNPGSETQITGYRSTGYRTNLLMRVAFSDALKGLVTEKEGYELGKGVQDWFLESSYGSLSFLTTVTPLLILPRTEAWYTAQDPRSYEVMSDAKAAAKEAGFDPSIFDFETVIYTGASGSLGMGAIGGKGCWLKSKAPGIACHEHGHNMGLFHSNFWSTTNGSVIGDGTSVEYGDPFDTMANGSLLESKRNIVVRPAT